MVEFEISTDAHSTFVDITSQVQRAVDEMGLENGAILVWAPHTTAGITVNEGADPDVVRDMIVALDRAVPWDAGWRHAEGNAAAHVKSLSLIHI